MQPELLFMLLRSELSERGYFISSFNHKKLILVTICDLLSCRQFVENPNNFKIIWNAILDIISSATGDNINLSELDIEFEEDMISSDTSYHRLKYATFEDGSK